MSFEFFLPARCPICANHWAAPFFDGGEAPLATLGWPRAEAQAQAMSSHRLDFVRCPSCGHIWNRAFRYQDIPYADQPNRMFNAGSLWQGHLAALANETLARLPARPTVVEIGCGSGHFLQALSVHQAGQYFGFDPHGSAAKDGGFEFQARLFEPVVDVPRYRPDLIVLRHVLEHFTEPAAFVEALAWAASQIDQPVRLLIEVPCIDRVFETGRIADFFYEHPQQFSTASFSALLERYGELERLSHAYGGEVVVGWLRLSIPNAWQETAHEAMAFRQASQQAQATIAEQLEALAQSGQRVAIWGGTGKAAAFMHYYGVDAERFPLVVDSDTEKVGTYVPGCGQRIQFRDVLRDRPAEVVIIPTQWRARHRGRNGARGHCLPASADRASGALDRFCSRCASVLRCMGAIIDVSACNGHRTCNQHYLIVFIADYLLYMPMIVLVSIFQ